MQDVETEWAALFQAASAGDGAAYERFLREFAPVLRGIVRARARSVPCHSYEDIVQEVLLAIHTKRHTWDPARPLRPWLFAIARHKAADAFRAHGGRVELDITDFADVLAAETEPDPTAAGDTRRLLAWLDPRGAEIVRAARLDGQALAVMGEHLRMSEGAVRVALHRAMRWLAALAQGTLR